MPGKIAGVERGLFHCFSRGFPSKGSRSISSKDDAPGQECEVRASIEGIDHLREGFSEFLVVQAIINIGIIA
jgi:hypothetical protein